MICYDYINEYIRETIKKNTGILNELEEYAKENSVPIIHPEVSRLLSVLCRTIKPKQILEIGTAIGYSSILMSEFLQSDGRIDTIDRFDLMIERAKINIKKAGLENTINLIEGDAVEILKELDNKYDIIFVDAAKGQYLEFFPHCMRMLNAGGLLISDNILYQGMIANKDLVKRRKKTIVKRMRDYLSTICEDERLDTSLIPIGDGFALSYKVKD